MPRKGARQGHQIEVIVSRSKWSPKAGDRSCCVSAIILGGQLQNPSLEMFPSQLLWERDVVPDGRKEESLQVARGGDRHGKNKNTKERLHAAN